MVRSPGGVGRNSTDRNCQRAGIPIRKFNKGNRYTLYSGHLSLILPRLDSSLTGDDRRDRLSRNDLRTRADSLSELRNR